MQTEAKFERWLDRIVIDADTGCWLWQGHLDGKGYARVRLSKTRATQLHRLFYERFVGPLDARLSIHHTCHTRRCLYPRHLVQLTRSEHSREHLDQFMAVRERGVKVSADVRHAATHCRNGHPREENAYTRRSDGATCCRECDRQKAKRYRDKQHLLRREEKP